MAASVEKIKELLGNGLSNEVVATAVGVTPSYINQLMANEQFSAEVVALRTQQLSAATSRDRSWDGLEDKLLSKLHENVDSGMVYKTADITRILMVANNAKRRGTTPQESLVVHNNVVNLTLPTMVVNGYKKNSTGEVVEVTTIDGKAQTLVTMPASALMRDLASKHQGNKDYDQIRKHLPPGNS